MKHLLFTLLLAICLAGCQSKPAGFPNIVQCNVIVTDNGKPIAGVSVSLHCESSVNYFSSGITDKNGVAEIKTSQGTYSQKGIPIGKVVLILNKTPKVDDWYTLEEQSNMPTDELMAYMEEKQRRSEKLPPVIPPKLTDASTTPLTKEINAATEWNVNIAEYKEK